MRPSKAGKWGTYQIKSGKSRVFRLEDAIQVMFKRVVNEVWIATTDLSKKQPDLKPLIPEQTETQEQPEQGLIEVTDEQIEASKQKWMRWALKSGNANLKIQPAFPNLPVVIQPEYSFRLMRGSSARFYTRIPVFIQVRDMDEGDLLITEIPSHNLARTWFGTFIDGEICYWFKTTARRELTEDVYRPYLCVCPITIINESEEELYVDKVSIRGEQLTVFGDGKSLWSDEMTIKYKGGKDFSDLIVTGVPPQEAPNATLLNKPRNPVSMGLARRTFRKLHDLHSKIG